MKRIPSFSPRRTAALAAALTLSLLLPGCGAEPAPAETPAASAAPQVSAAPSPGSTPEISAAPQVSSTPEASAAPELTDPSAVQTVPEASYSAISLPCTLAEGKLEVSSLFQFTGFNPDCGGAQGTDIAALQLKNVSGEHLASAELTLTLNDSVPVAFRITDLPAGAEAMVFSAENVTMTPDDVGTALSGSFRFLPESPLMQGQVDFTADNMTITLTNCSDQELTQFDVCCHSMLDGICFGGLTYSYPVDSLPAGASISVDALDCYLGGALVSRISAE